MLWQVDPHPRDLRLRPALRASARAPVGEKPLEEGRGAPLEQVISLNSDVLAVVSALLQVQALLNEAVDGEGSLAHDVQRGDKSWLGVRGGLLSRAEDTEDCTPA